MRIALTGGGTGGHVYPALEVGRLAAEEGEEVRYFGSLRGIEGAACLAIGMPFFGVKAEPIPNLMSLSGMRSAIDLLKSSKKVAAAYAEWRPDVLLATGGYSSVPALRAAKRMRVPIVLLEQNSVPGRAIKSMGSAASKICTVFAKTAQFFDTSKIVVTGMPVRRELVARAPLERDATQFTTLAMGGSQGARALNTAVVDLAQTVGSDRWIHVAGPNLYDEVLSRKKSMPSGYELESFLDGDSMAAALGSADLAIARAGSGTIAELALFGVPTIFIPLPTSFAQHQHHNAREIEGLGGGTLLDQSDLGRLESTWRKWRDDVELRERASLILKSWAKPEAARSVLQVVKEAAK